MFADMPIKAIILIAVSFFLAGSVTHVQASEPSRVIIKTRLVSENYSKAMTVIFALEPGVEKVFGPRFPKLRIVVLPVEADQVPLLISLFDERGATLSSITVYYTPETGAEFSLDADGIDAEGQISHFSRVSTE